VKGRGVEDDEALETFRVSSRVGTPDHPAPIVDDEIKWGIPEVEVIDPRREVVYSATQRIRIVSL